MTLDATGCPTKIVSPIVEQEADDILAVKNKQPGLAKVVDLPGFFGPVITLEKGHGTVG